MAGDQPVDKHTEADPFAKVAFLGVGVTHETLLEVAAKVFNESVEEGLDTYHATLAVVFDNGALHPGMFSLISGAE